MIFRIPNIKLGEKTNLEEYRFGLEKLLGPNLPRIIVCEDGELALGWSHSQCVRFLEKGLCVLEHGNGRQTTVRFRLEDKCLVFSQPNYALEEI
jgi:hypothetical protein